MSQFIGKANSAYRVLIGSYTGLYLILLVSTLNNPPSTIEPGLMLWLTGLGIWTFKIAPLLLFIPGLIKRSHKTAAWLAYMIMLYFVLAVMLAFTPGGSGWGWLLVADTMLIFLSALMFIRWQKRVEAGM